MKLVPSLIHGLNGQPVTPVIKADLEPLAKDATAQLLGRETTLQGVAKDSTLQTLAKEATLLAVAKESTLQILLTAIQALPRVSTKVNRVTINLGAALNNYPVPLGALTRVHSMNVVDLTGSVVPTMRFNGLAEAAIPLAKGEIRSGMDVSTLHLTCGAGGGNLVLELIGR